MAPKKTVSHLAPPLALASARSKKRTRPARHPVLPRNMSRRVASLRHLSLRFGLLRNQILYGVESGRIE